MLQALRWRSWCNEYQQGWNPSLAQLARGLDLSPGLYHKDPVHHRL